MYDCDDCVTWDMGDGWEYVWNGSLTVRVFHGLDEVDVISFMEKPTPSEVEAAIKGRDSNRTLMGTRFIPNIKVDR